MQNKTSVKKKLTIKIISALVSFAFIIASGLTLVFDVVNSNTTAVAAPARTTELTGYRFTQVVAGVEHYVGLTAEGDVFTWGKNTRGQLGFLTMPQTDNGDGTLTAKTTNEVTGTFENIYSYEFFTPQLLIDHKNTSSAYDGTGAQNLRRAFIALVPPTSDPNPVAYASITFESWYSTLNEVVVQIAALEYGTAALTSGGNIIYWGDNTYEQANYSKTSGANINFTMNSVLPEGSISSKASFGKKPFVSNANSGNSNPYHTTPCPRVVFQNANNVFKVGTATLSQNVINSSPYNNKISYRAIAAGAKHYIASGVYNGVPIVVNFGNVTYGQSYASGSMNDPALINPTVSGSYYNPVSVGSRQESIEQGTARNDLMSYEGVLVTKATNENFAPLGLGKDSLQLAANADYVEIYAGGYASLYGTGGNYVASGRNYYSDQTGQIIRGALGTMTAASTSSNYEADTHYYYGGRQIDSGLTATNATNRFLRHTLKSEFNPGAGVSASIVLERTAVTVQNASGVEQTYLKASGAGYQRSVSLGTTFGLAVNGGDVTKANLTAHYGNKGETTTGNIPKGKGLYAWGAHDKKYFSNLFDAQAIDATKKVYSDRVFIDFSSILGTDTIRQVSSGKFLTNDETNQSIESEGLFANAILSMNGKVYIWGNDTNIRFMSDAGSVQLNDTPQCVIIPGNPKIVNIFSGYGKIIMTSDVGRIYILAPASKVNPNNSSVLKAIDYIYALDIAQAKIANANYTSFNFNVAQNKSTLTQTVKYVKAVNTSVSGTGGFVDDGYGLMSTADGDALRWVLPRNPEETYKTVQTSAVNTPLVNYPKGSLSGTKMVADTVTAKDYTKDGNTYTVPATRGVWGNFDGEINNRIDGSASYGESVLDYKVEFFTPDGNSYLTTTDSKYYGIYTDYVKKYIDIDFVFAKIIGANGTVDRTSIILPDNANMFGTDLFNNYDLVMRMVPKRRCKIRLTAYIAEYDRYSQDDFYTSGTMLYNVHKVPMTVEINNNTLSGNTEAFTPGSTFETFNEYSLDASGTNMFKLDANDSGQIYDSSSKSRLTLSYANITGYTNDQLEFSPDNPTFTIKDKEYMGLEGLRRYLQLKKPEDTSIIQRGLRYSDAATPRELGVAAGSSDPGFSSNYMPFGSKLYYDYLSEDYDSDFITESTITEDAISVLNPSYFCYVNVSPYVSSTEIYKQVDKCNACYIAGSSHCAAAGKYYNFIDFAIDGDYAALIAAYSRDFAYGGFRITVSGTVKYESANNTLSDRILGYNSSTNKTYFRVSYGRLVVVAKKAISSEDMGSVVPEITINLTDGFLNKGGIGLFKNKYTVKFIVTASTTLSADGKNNDGTQYIYNKKLHRESSDRFFVGAVSQSGYDPTNYLYLGESYTINISDLFTDSTDLYFLDDIVSYNSQLLGVDFQFDAASEYKFGKRKLIITPKLLTSESGSLLKIRVGKATQDLNSAQNMEITEANTKTVTANIFVYRKYTYAAYTSSEDLAIPSYIETLQIDSSLKRINKFFTSQEAIKRDYEPFDFFKITDSISTQEKRDRRNVLKFVAATTSDPEVLTVKINTDSVTGKTTLAFDNLNVGKVSITLTVTDNYTTITNTFTDGADLLPVSGAFVGRDYKINTTQKISALQLGAYTNTIMAVNSFKFNTDASDSTLPYVDVFRGSAKLDKEDYNKYFTLSLSSDKAFLDIIPIKGTEKLTIVFSINNNGANVLVKCTLEILKYDAVVFNTETKEYERFKFELTTSKSASKSFKKVVKDIVGDSKVPDVSETNSKIYGVNLFGNAINSQGEVVDSVVTFEFTERDVTFTAIQDGMQEIQFFMYDTNSNKYYSVNLFVYVEGIKTVLTKEQYIAVFAGSAAGCFVLLLVVFILRMVAYSKASAKQNKIIKKNRMLIEMRDKMHNKTSKASKEDIVRTKLKMNDKRYQSAFDKARKEQEARTGVTLMNSKVAQAVNKNIMDKSRDSQKAVNMRRKQIEQANKANNKATTQLQNRQLQSQLAAKQNVINQAAQNIPQPMMSNNNMNMGMPPLNNMNAGMPNMGMPPLNNMNAGMPNMGMPPLNNMNAGMPNMGMPPLNNMNAGMPNMGMPPLNNMNAGMPNMGMPPLNNMNAGMPNMGMPLLNNMNAGMPNMGTPNMGGQMPNNLNQRK